MSCYDNATRVSRTWPAHVTHMHCVLQFRLGGNWFMLLLNWRVEGRWRERGRGREEGCWLPSRPRTRTRKELTSCSIPVPTKLTSSEERRKREGGEGGRESRRGRHPIWLCNQQPGRICPGARTQPGNRRLKENSHVHVSRVTCTDDGTIWVLFSLSVMCPETFTSWASVRVLTSPVLVKKLRTFLRYVIRYFL